jgi:hypothetical protein
VPETKGLSLEQIEAKLLARTWKKWSPNYYFLSLLIEKFQLTLTLQNQ